MAYLTNDDQLRVQVEVSIVIRFQSIISPQVRAPQALTAHRWNLLDLIIFRMCCVHNIVCVSGIEKPLIPQLYETYAKTENSVIMTVSNNYYLITSHT